MGSRVHILLVTDHCNNISLMSNNSHEDLNIMDTVLTSTSNNLGQPTKILRELLSASYPSDKGNHKAGDPVFYLSDASGDEDYCLTITNDGVHKTLEPVNQYVITTLDFDYAEEHTIVLSERDIADMDEDALKDYLGDNVSILDDDKVTVANLSNTKKVCIVDGKERAA